MNRMRIAALCASLLASAAFADEGGVSFWLPGQQSNFAALPGAPGFSMPLMYYHASVSSGSSKNFVTGGNLVAGLEADADLLFFVPTYTFKEPVAGGQAALSLAWAVGQFKATASSILTGREGGSNERGRTDKASGGSDLYPLASLKWHEGDSSTMAYVMGGIPVGVYQAGRLANIGLNHASIDGGFGYTYMAKGNEFSVVGGITYNWENDDTNYKNGVDSHVDFAFSHFFSPQLHAGVVGYAYYQLSGDSGSGAVLGDYKARVYALGPQVGYFFPMGKEKAYVSLRGYYEFNAQNRADGWNTYLAASIPLGL
ncbi:hypothetical protein DSM104443_01895 [Usitatibacter rugosus]|uniref:Phenol degradation protein n=1 Tax=Usitatibacter rugosus TaxID=2732067 RepID=A0A6M4GV03_9PROT|nr:transporter [Usitatibacter rugosus]QJR10825.1 hypothetical protein DSM104443_01895 [Usitatibacter rugosus]